MIGAGLTLVTGATGSGKTAYVVSLLKEMKDRPIFVMGVPELQIEHYPCPPVSEWVEHRADPDDPSLSLPYFSFPPNAVVVLDEAQRVYRPRSVGSKVPPEVAAFETRRHTGVDFVLITQHPTFIDSNVRKLVTRHVHIHSTFLGAYRLEWVGLGEPDVKTSRDLASRVKYKPPAKVFGLYKSAELHTKPVVKRPWYFFALPVLAVAVVGGGVVLYDRFKAKTAGPVVTAEQSSKPVDKKAGPAPGQKPETLTTAEYIAQQQPRIAGLLHTAPVYDALTTPVDVPVPQGCVSSKKTGCKCYDQRGNHYRTTPAICQQFMEGGIFFAFKPEPVEKVAARQVTTDAPAAAAPVSASVLVPAQAEPKTAAPPASPVKPPMVPSDSPWRFKG